MAFLKLFSFSLLLLQISDSLSSSLFLPVTKHASTHHYLTRIFHGSSPILLPTFLIVDLNSPFPWLDCSSSSDSITAVHSRSIQCTSATSNPSLSSSSNPPCSLPIINPFTGASSNGELVQHAISLHDDEISAVDSFLLSCAPSDLVSGLPSGSTGVLGLGRTRVSAVSQFSHFFDYPKKFSLCLSPTDGMISSGNDENEVYKSMIYTPLLENANSSYNIIVKSLKIQNKKLPIEDLSSVKISTVDLYSKMETRVYQEFVKGFIKEADILNMMRVPPIGGFELCYGVEGSRIVPVIDLVLQSEMVKWRIYGHNSMVKVNEEVMCLGFLDGGNDLNGASIILGTHQIEDNLLEFDLGSSMLGFSSSLLKMRTSCSQLTLSTMPMGKGIQSS
ncbi:Basic 7S globulin [Bienertia sinuspersici]